MERESTTGVSRQWITQSGDVQTPIWSTGNASVRLRRTALAQVFAHARGLCHDIDVERAWRIRRPLRFTPDDDHSRTVLVAAKRAAELPFVGTDGSRGIAGRKSQLAPNAWREPKARLSVFEAQVFSR